MLREDEEGRYPLSGREYNDLRSLLIAFNEVIGREENLLERLRKIPNGLRDYRLIKTKMSKLEDDILDTVPTKKLLAFKNELENSKIVLTSKWTPVPQEGIVHLREDAFLALLNRLISYECWSCDKKGRDVKKCPIRQTYLDCLHYEPAPDEIPKDGSCVMTGWMSVQVDDGDKT